MVNDGRLEALPIGSTLDAERGTFGWQLGPGFVGRLRPAVRAHDRRPPGTHPGAHRRPAARVGGHDAAGRLGAGGRGSVPSAFTVDGWAQNGPAQGLGEIFVYAYPTDGSAPAFVGEAALAAGAADAHTAFGGQFARTPFSIPVTDLLPGTYDLLVVGRSRLSSALDAAVWVGPITVR